MSPLPPLLPPGLNRFGPRGERSFLLVRWRVLWLFAGLALMLVMVALWALSSGTLPLGGAGVLRWLEGRASADEALVLGQLRLPRIALAMLCGAMLGLAGAAMQSATGNALADPGLLGVKEGALVALLGTSLAFPLMDPTWRPLIGLSGGVAAMALVAGIARRLSGLRFILIGIGISWVLASFLTLFMTVSRPETAHAVLIWMAGSLHAGSWGALGQAAPWALLGAGLLFATARAGNVAELGPAVAGGLGLRAGRLALLRLGAGVMLTASATAAIGALGFVGLVAPHLARQVFGARQLALLSGSAICGAGLLLAADSLGRVLFAPVQIPAGVVIALIGVPMFLLILWRRRSEL